LDEREVLAASLSQRVAKEGPGMRATLYALTLTIVISSSGAAFGEPNEAARIALERQLQPQCAVAAVPADHELILVGAVDPQTITNLVFEGARDEAGLITVEVERGNRPVTLAIAAQQDLIWEVSGAIDRLRHVIVLANEQSRRSGIIGMPPERVVFGEVTACHSLSWSAALRDYAQKPAAWRDFGLFLGRKPDKVLVLDDAMSLGIPSARIGLGRNPGAPGVLIEQGDASGIERTRIEFGMSGRARVVGRVAGPARTPEEEELLELLDSNPGGIRKLDPGYVVTQSRLQTSVRIDRLLK
jgi:hypothetical protein